MKCPKCRRCWARIRANDGMEVFLLPFADGTIKKIAMHSPRCVERFNALATGKVYSESFERKRKAFLRTTGVYCA